MSGVDLILGVDPGAHGALALYSELFEELREVIDMPSHRVTSGGTQKTRLDLYALGVWIDGYAKRIKRAVVEDVHAMPKQGVSSSFQFGFAAGAVQAVIAAHLIPMQLVRPAVWKKAMTVTADKDSSRRAASMLLPKSQHLWSRVKDDGRAEAVLLAIYGAKQ
jgi:crossover junction endodeoxyribonuclease RuvC